MSHFPYLDAPKIEELHEYLPLIDALEEALRQGQINHPLRQHYSYGQDNTLLTMPAWEDGRDIGIKLVTVTPTNREKDLPSIQGVVVYFDADTGAPLALLDAAALTRKRTAAASALASRYLSRKDSNRLLVLGTGALAPELIRAHTSVRPIQEVYIWGRTFSKAKELEERLENESYQVKAIREYDEFAPTAAIISTATMATSPLLHSRHLAAGQHLDLVGSYKPHMREVDDDVIRQVRIFVDNRRGATHESGELYLPLQSGVLQSTDIGPELGALCGDAEKGRNTNREITAFKSVGFALEDLVAARFYYERYLAAHS